MTQRAETREEQMAKAVRVVQDLLGDKAATKVEKAGLEGKDKSGHRLSFHGLRKALGTRLAGTGCSSHEIAAVLGTTPRTAEVYTKAYDRERAADTAAEKMVNISPPSRGVIRLKTRGESK